MQLYIRSKTGSMMKKLLFIALWLWVGTVYGQVDSIACRVVVFGDAGEVNLGQKKLLKNAEEMVIPMRTVAFFLGDNIYPDGMPIDTSMQEKERSILRSQYLPFQEKAVPVYFLAGNHDWDHSRKEGLAKLQAQEQFLYNQVGSQVKLIPAAGTPGPVAIELTDQVVVIAIDSEYWLFPHHQTSEKDRAEKWELFKADVARLLQQNRDKTILFLAHHPLRTYSEHGLKFSWRQHIFPLTSKWSNLYIPLPVVGSLFPLFRSTVFRSAEDLPHPVYKAYREGLEEVIAQHGSLVFVSGHDHVLQHIATDNFQQIVSGAGSKTSSIVKGKNLLYSYPRQGYCLIDCTVDGQLYLRFYTYNKGKVTVAYETHLVQ